MAEKQKRKNGNKFPIHVFWPIFGAIIVFLFLLISTISGAYLVRLGPEFTLSIYGGLVILRQIWLQRAAYLHNAEVIKVLAAPVRDKLIEQYPEQERKIARITNTHQPFDRMRRRLMNQLGLDYEQWTNLRREYFTKYFSGNRIPPVVMGLAPIYGIPWEQIEEQAWSLVSQTYPFSKFWFVVNDATDTETINNLLNLIPQLNTAVEEDVFQLYVEPSPGKRKAMFQGFNFGLVTPGYVMVGDKKRNALKNALRKADLVLNTDGDTYLDIDAVANAVLSFEAYPDVDLITGDVRVSNYKVNLLTRYTGLRYWIAFWKERAAQSWARKYIPKRMKIIRGQMVCASGPFLIMRAHRLVEILDEWYEQTFMGEECTYGDDRHLTTLGLLRGWGTMFINGCIVWTDAPTDLKQWVRQQYRWGQSANRENWWLVDNEGLENLTWLVKFDLFYLTFFPFLIAGAVISVLVMATNAFLAELTPLLYQAFSQSVGYMAFMTGFLIVFSEMLNFAKLGMKFPGSRRARAFQPIWDRLSIYISGGTALSFILVLLLNGFNFFDPTVVQGLAAFWDVVGPYLLVIIVLQFLFQSVYGFLLTGDWFFLLWFGYNYLYFRYLMKQKITTIIGMRITAWGTRSAVADEMKSGEGG